MRPTTAPGRANLFSLLVDSSFTELVTPRIVKGLYGLSVAAAALLALLVGTSGLDESLWIAVGWSVFALLVFLVVVAAARIGLEAALVFFRLADDAQEIAEHGAAIALNTAAAQTPAAKEQRPKTLVYQEASDE